jgi:beta-lactamase class A
VNDEALVSRLRDELDDGGLRGSFLVRDLRTRREISIDPDLEFPSASLVKVPLAAATLDRIRRANSTARPRSTSSPAESPHQGRPGSLSSGTPHVSPSTTCCTSCWRSVTESRPTRYST